jgi:ABC-type amino acid transport substrate-binding protein
MMSVPFSEDALVNTSLAGTYVNNGPAFFISFEDAASEATASAESTETDSAEESFEASLTIDTLSEQRVGAQEGSVAYWILEYEFGADAIASYPTLREAMDALVAGEIDVLAGDAMVTSYIASDGYESVVFAGQVAPATPLGIAVGLEAAELEEAVRGALDELAADGVLTTIRAKWVGDLPELETEALE